MSIAAALCSQGYAGLAENILGHLQWRDILSCSQVCTNLNDIVTQNVRAQILLRAALVGRNASSLPHTKETLERMIDVERRWTKLAPKAYDETSTSFRVMAMSDGVMVTDEYDGWTVRDFWNMRNPPFPSMACQRFVAPGLELKTSSQSVSYAENAVVSRHDNLFAVLQEYRDPDQDLSGRSPIAVKVRLHLFKLFSDMEPVGKRRHRPYTPIPHPEAAQPVVEVGSFVVPASNGTPGMEDDDMDEDDHPCRLYHLDPAASRDGSGRHLLYELKLGFDGTLLVRVISRSFGDAYVHDMPTSLWNWRTGKMVMDLRLTEESGRLRRQGSQLWPFHTNTVDTYLTLPTGNVLALGLVPTQHTKEPLRYPVHADIDGPCDARGQRDEPMSVFSLISDKPDATPSAPNVLSPWEHFESSAVSCRGPTCLVSHGNPRTAPTIATDENRLQFSLTTAGSQAERYTFNAAQLQRLLLTPQRYRTLSLRDWVHGMDTTVGSLCEPSDVYCIGGLRTCRIHTLPTEPSTDEDEEHYHEYDVHYHKYDGRYHDFAGVSTLHVSSSTTTRSRLASPLASRHPRGSNDKHETPVTKARFRHAMKDVNIVARRPQGCRELEAKIPPNDYVVVYAGSEHLVAISEESREVMYSRSASIHVWAF